MLTPALALITWSLIVWVWMYALRLPAITKAELAPDDAKHPGSLVQNTINKFLVRFGVFSLSTIVLMVIPAKNFIAL